MYEPTAEDWKAWRDYEPAVNEYVPSPAEIREWKLRINAENGLTGPPPAPAVDWESLEHILECEVDDE